MEAEYDIITTVTGENAILPCRLITKHLPPSMELQWRKVGPGKDKLIYFYLYDESSPLVNSYPQSDKCPMSYLSPNGDNSREWLRKEYEKKAEVFKGKEFGKGNISLKLNNIQVEDEGKYVCSASANLFHREIIIEVLVIGKKSLELEKANRITEFCYISSRASTGLSLLYSTFSIALSIIVLKLLNNGVSTSSIGKLLHGLMHLTVRSVS